MLINSVLMCAKFAATILLQRMKLSPVSEPRSKRKANPKGANKPALSLYDFYHAPVVATQVSDVLIHEIINEPLQPCPPLGEDWF